ncbi:MAG: sulfotransferase domain-containing protein [Moorea sp. SIO2I5]|nr:sulfotransferase domain-containing protein [Moorena sp. SIO2I5]
MSKSTTILSTSSNAVPVPFVLSFGKKVVGKLKILRHKIRNYVLMPPHHQFILQSLQQQSLQQQSILLAGHPKSGNTWTRFVIFNYFNILLNDADKTLTYVQLSAIQQQVFDDYRIIMGHFMPGFPILVRTHSPYRKVFRYFGRVIFLYRNPLDVLISLYRVEEKRTGQTVKDIPIDAFVLSRLLGWISHYTSIINRCDVIMRYEDMRADPYGEFNRLFHALGIEVQEHILRQSLDLSSFENIRRMGRETNQQNGNHHLYTFKGEFTRSGQVKQYQGVLKAETIQACQEMLRRQKIEIDLSI